MVEVVGGSVVWDLDVDKKKLTAGLADANAQIDKAAKDGQKKISSITDSFDKASKSIDSAGNSMIKMGAAPAAALGVITARVSSFQTAMSNVSTLISGDSTEAVRTLSDEVIELAKRMPKSVDELGGSLYDVLSAGISGTANQMLVLENSAMLATAGLGDTKGATDLMTSAINAFGLSAQDSEFVADTLFKTVKFGKTTVDQMAQSFGASAPVIASAKISLEEFSAATAALTTTGLPASQSQNSLRQSVVALQKPTKEMSELFKLAGIESGQASLEQIGLVDTMLAVKKAADGNSEALAKAWGSVEALGAATSLTGDQFDSFNSTWIEMNMGANAMGEAFDKQSKTVASQGQIMTNNLDAIALSLSETLIPSINEMLESLKPVVQAIADFAKKNPKAITTVLTLGAALVPLGIAFKAIAAGVGAVSAAMKAAEFVKNLKATATAVKGLNTAFAFLAANPIVIVIALIVAAIVLLALAWKNNWFDIQGKTKAAIDFIGNAFNGFVEFMKAAWTSITTGFINFLKFVITFPAKVDEFFKRLPFLIAETLGMALGFLVKWGVDSWNYLKTNVPIWIDNTVNWFKELPGKIWGELVATKDQIVRWGVDTWNYIKTTVPMIIGSVVNWFKELPGKIGGSLSSMASTTKAKFVETWEAIVAEVKQFPGRLLDWGRNMGNSFVQGVKDSLSGLKDAFTNGFNNARGSVEGHSPPKEGPFKNIDKWGFNIGMAWVDGMKNAIGSVSSSIGSTFSTGSSDLTSPTQTSAGVLGSSPVSSGGGGFNQNITIQIENVGSQEDIDSLIRRLGFLAKSTPELAI
jgi:TP901 family phage tail tape measure protein